jgi:hypothetical protein
VFERPHRASGTIVPVGRLALMKVVGSAGVLAMCGLVLWLHQTDLALLRVDSYGAAVGQAGFWAAPSVVLYLGLVWSRRSAAQVGALLTAVLFLQWWSSATDQHSTASLGPGLVGWFFGPVAVVLVAATDLHRRRER